MQIKQARKPAIHEVFTSLRFFPFQSPLKDLHYHRLTAVSLSFTSVDSIGQKTLMYYIQITAASKSLNQGYQDYHNGHGINDETDSVSESL